MSVLRELGSIVPTQIWTDIVARIVEGDRITMAVVELPPNGRVPEHQHENEQIGMCLAGSVTFRIGDEKREMNAGGTWKILGNVPHEATAGPHGAVVVEVFSPIRSDWKELPSAPDADLRWPHE